MKYEFDLEGMDFDQAYRIAMKRARIARSEAMRDMVRSATRSVRDLFSRPVAVQVAGQHAKS